MSNLLIAFVVSAFAGLLCSPPLVGFLKRWRALDVPNERSSHSVPVPVGGGIGILGPWCLGMGAFAVIGVFPSPGLPLSLLVGAAVLAGLGFVDDRRGLSPTPRLIVQALVAAACLKAGGLPVVAMELPGSAPVPLGAWGWAAAWLFVVGFTNMFNFMDGINGLAGIQALLGAGALAVWGALSGDASLAVSMALLAGGTVGFLPQNFPRARVFMGDVGSLPLGFLLSMGVLRAHAGPDGAGGTPLWMPLLLIWPFLGDATFTLVNRAVHGRNPFHPHRSHVYQRLVVSGWSHLRVTLHYAAAMAVCIAAAFVCRVWSGFAWPVFWGIVAATLCIALATAARIRAVATRRDAGR